MPQMSDEMIRKCPRCKGFLIRAGSDNCDGQVHRIEVFRCLNCGERVNATVLIASESRDRDQGQQKNQHFFLKESRLALISVKNFERVV